MLPAHPPRRWFLAIAVAVSIGASGCSTLDPVSDDPFVSSEAATAVTETEEVPRFSVEFYPNGGQPERLELPLKRVTYVQDAIQQSGALKRFARIKIQLYRRQPNATVPHKLDIEYDRGKRGVPARFDYAMYPGDRLVIIEDTSNIFDDMLEALGGPLDEIPMFQR